ncbi:unnamed protein product, partial [Oppiella nova]
MDSNEEVASDHIDHLDDKVLFPRLTLRLILISIAILGIIFAIIGLFGSYYQNYATTLLLSVLNTFNSFYCFGASTHYQTVFILWVFTIINIVVTFSGYLYTILLCLQIGTHPINIEHMGRTLSMDSTGRLDEPFREKSVSNPPPYEDPPHYSQLNINKFCR